MCSILSQTNIFELLDGKNFTVTRQGFLLIVQRTHVCVRISVMLKIIEMTFFNLWNLQNLGRDAMATIAK